MNLSIEMGVPVLTVFVQGLLSFFLPVFCLWYLSMWDIWREELSVRMRWEMPAIREKGFCSTHFFVVGVSFAFFALGFGFSAAGQFFSSNRALLAKAGGILMILFGLYQLGVLGKSSVMEKEHRLPLRMDRLAMNPLAAFALGFGFSFAWTPCVGPALAGVLLMVSSAGSQADGFLLIGIYTLGFVLPFLAVGLFTGSVLNFFRRHGRIIRYTVRIGGVLLILMGVMTLTGWMNGVTGYLSQMSGGSRAGTESAEEQQTLQEDEAQGEVPKENGGRGSDSGTVSGQEEGERTIVPAPEITLTDQYGNEHTLSDYKGKTVFLNFWATWCGPCKQEMPDIQRLYEEYGSNEEDLVVLGVANPSTETYRGNDMSTGEVTVFLEENGYNYPVLMDTTGDIFRVYGVTAFPTTFMIDAEGNIYGYVTGSLTADMLESIVTQTMESNPKPEE